MTQGWQTRRGQRLVVGTEFRNAVRVFAKSQTRYTSWRLDQAFAAVKAIGGRTVKVDGKWTVRWS